VSQSSIIIRLYLFLSLFQYTTKDSDTIRERLIFILVSRPNREWT